MGYFVTSTIRVARSLLPTIRPIIECHPSPNATFQRESDATEADLAAGISQPGIRLSKCPQHRGESSGLEFGSVSTLDGK